MWSSDARVGASHRAGEDTNVGGVDARGGGDRVYRRGAERRRLVAVARVDAQNALTPRPGGGRGTRGDARGARGRARRRGGRRARGRDGERAKSRGAPRARRRRLRKAGEGGGGGGDASGAWSAGEARGAPAVGTRCGGNAPNAREDDAPRLDMVSADADGRSERERRLARARRAQRRRPRQLPPGISVGQAPAPSCGLMSSSTRSRRAHANDDSVGSKFSVLRGPRKIAFPNRARQSPNRVRAVRHPRRRARGSPPTARPAMSTSAVPSRGAERVRGRRPRRRRARDVNTTNPNSADEDAPSRPTRRQHVPTTTPSPPRTRARPRSCFRGADCEDADRSRPPPRQALRGCASAHPRHASSRWRRSSPPCARAARR